MTKKRLNWANLKFPPINLWNAPRKDTLQEEIDYFISEVKEIDEVIAESESAIKVEIIMLKRNYILKKLVEKQLRDSEFQQYLKIGKFND